MWTAQWHPAPVQMHSTFQVHWSMLIPLKFPTYETRSTQSNPSHIWAAPEEIFSRIYPQYAHVQQHRNSLCHHSMQQSAPAYGHRRYESPSTDILKDRDARTIDVWNLAKFDRDISILLVQMMRLNLRACDTSLLGFRCKIHYGLSVTHYTNAIKLALFSRLDFHTIPCTCINMPASDSSDRPSLGSFIPS